MRQFKLIWALFKMKTARQTAFRLGFFGPLFVDGTLFALQMLMFSAIYAHVDEIAGWGKGQMLLFIGTFSLIDALNMTIFFFGLNNLTSLIKSGDFDGYLTRPMNPLLRVSLENVSLGSAPLIAVSAAIIAYAARLMGGTDIWHALGYLALVVMMLLLWYDIMLLLRCIAFFAISVASAERVEGALLEMCLMLPGPAFKGGFKLVFTVLLPYGIIATVPTQFFAGLLTGSAFLRAAATVAAFTVLSVALFRIGCKNYKSASS